MSHGLVRIFVITGERILRGRLFRELRKLFAKSPTEVAATVPRGRGEVEPSGADLGRSFLEAVLVGVEETDGLLSTAASEGNSRRQEPETPKPSEQPPGLLIPVI